MCQVFSSGENIIDFVHMAGDWCDWSSQYHQHDYITSDSRATWSEEIYGSMAQRVKKSTQRVMNYSMTITNAFTLWLIVLWR